MCSSAPSYERVPKSHWSGTDLAAVGQQNDLVKPPLVLDRYEPGRRTLRVPRRTEGDERHISQCHLFAIAKLTIDAHCREGQTVSEDGVASSPSLQCFAILRHGPYGRRPAASFNRFLQIAERPDMVDMSVAVQHELDIAEFEAELLNGFLDERP